MPQQSSSQPPSSQASATTGREDPSHSVGRNDGLFLGISSSTDNLATASSQPSSSRLPRALVTEARENDAASHRVIQRQAKRRRREEYEPYQVRGWENLYGGGASGPSDVNRTSSSFKQQGEAVSSSKKTSERVYNTLSSQHSIRSNVTAAWSAGQDVSQSNSTGAQLPSSSAPTLPRHRASHVASSSTAKRKARSSPSHSMPIKKARPPPTSQEQAVPDPTPSDSDDDDFQITGVIGPAFKPDVAQSSTIPAIKASPSPGDVLKVSQHTQQLRRPRSLSRSTGRASPAAPTSHSLPEKEQPEFVSDPSSQRATQHQDSNAGAVLSSNGLTDRSETIAPIMPSKSAEETSLEAIAGSADSPQAYEPPPEEPIGDLDQGSPQEAVEPPRFKPEELQSDANAEASTAAEDQDETAASLRLTDGREFEEEGGEEEQDYRQVGHVMKQDVLEEEDELANELLDDEPASSRGTRDVVIAPDDGEEDVQMSAGDKSQTHAPSLLQAAEPGANAKGSPSPNGDVAPTNGQLAKMGYADPHQTLTVDPIGNSEQLAAGSEAGVSSDECEQAADGVARPLSGLRMSEVAEAAPEGIGQASMDILERLQRVEAQTEPTAEQRIVPQAEHQLEHSDQDQGDQSLEHDQQGATNAQDPVQGDNHIDDPIDVTPAPDQERAAVEHSKESITGGLNTTVEPGTNQVASVVEAVEQTIAATSEVFPPEAVKAKVTVPNEHTEADDPMQGRAEAAYADVVDAASGFRTITTSPSASPSRAAEEESGAPAAGTSSDEEVSKACYQVGRDSAPVEPGPSQQSGALRTEEPATEIQGAPTTSAAAVVPALHNMASTLGEVANAVVQAPVELIVDQQLDPSTEGISDKRYRADRSQPVPGYPETSPPSQTVCATTKIRVDANAAEADRDHARQESQAASDSTPTPSSKRTVDDRMRSMLRDLANVTGRASSFDTMQKLKKARGCASASRTISDLVKNWQDPTNMIPWVCLQEVTPAILHRNADKKMHFTMHQLMDMVSSTRSVTHLMAKLPVRVMARALMEFPGVPHMLHSWNEEKKLYFIKRGLPQPTNTQPEFRFADREDQDNTAGTGRASAAPSSIDSPMQLEGVDREPMLNAAGTTQSHLMVPLASAHASGMNLPAVVAIPSQASPQMMTAAGSRLLTTHVAGNQQRATPSDHSAHLAAATAAAHVGRTQHQPTIGPALHRPSAQTAQNAQTAQSSQTASTLDTERARILRLHLAQLQQTQQRAQQQQAAQVGAQQVEHQQVQHQQQVAQRQAQEQAQLPAQRQQLSPIQQAAMINQATESVFSALAGDCLSFAEQVIALRGSKEANLQRHFSEADVLHVISFVVNTYQAEVEEQIAAGKDAAKASDRLHAISKVHTAAKEVLVLTKTLNHIKICLNEAALIALRRSGIASTVNWLHLLRTSPRWRHLRELLLRGSPETTTLSGHEVEMMLQRRIEVVGKRLEELLERMVETDSLVGKALEEATEEERDAREGMRKECEQIGLICCKHVVGVLFGEPDQSSGTRG